MEDGEEGQNEKELGRGEESSRTGEGAGEGGGER